MTGDQITEAAKLWNEKLTSAEIAQRLKIPEHYLVKFIPAIKHHAKHHAKAATK